MVRHAGAFGLLAVSDHDAGKLVDGHRAPGDGGLPHAWLFFVPFILVTTFAVVNLVVGLIVNSMQDAHHAEDAEKTDSYRDEVFARLERIETLLQDRGKR